MDFYEIKKTFSVTLTDNQRIKFDQNGVILSGQAAYAQLDHYTRQFVTPEILKLHAGLEKCAIRSFSVSAKPVLHSIRQ